MPRKSKARRPTAGRQTKSQAAATGAERWVAILFADIIGCSEVSNHMALEKYNDFLDSFHLIFDKVATEHRKSFYVDAEDRYFQAKTRGDEGLLIIMYPDKQEDMARDLDTCVNFALDLKRMWLLNEENRRRIEGPSLLPIDLAIGIHLGKVLVNDDADGELRPEGYAINLTKRIESASRDGQYTRIFVSASARGELDLLHDEMNYAFGPLRELPAKGILHGIRVFEVTHHFLATDWNEDRPGYPKTRAVAFDPSDEDVALAWQAHRENPTNFWLAEEFIKLKLLREWRKLETEGVEEDSDRLKKAYDDAKQVCQRFISGGRGEAELLVIAGFIAGECMNYDEEQKLYREALEENPRYAEGHWYLGLSMSYQLAEKLNREKKSSLAYSDLEREEQRRVDEIQKSFRRAIELKPQQPWMHLDLAAEMSRFDADKAAAILQLKAAYDLNPIVGSAIRGEPYFQPIIDHPKVQILLP